MITITILAGVAMLGILLMMFELRNAPEGFEDETGFHVDWHNNRPDITDVSCIWLSASQMVGNQSPAGAHAAY